MSIENYKKKLESMSKEELLHEISNLINDHGIQLEQLKEEKKTLIWLNQDLEKQVDELKERLHIIFALGFDYDGCDKAESLKGLIDELVKITQMDSKEFAEYYKGVEVE